MVNQFQKRVPSNNTTRLALCFSVICFLFGSGLPASPQTVDAQKFDEFGDIAASDLIARLDNLATQLQNRPATKAFLVVYRDRRDLPGLSNRYAHRMRDYLLESRGIDPTRLITVDGGVASCLTQELWLAPPGTTPKPRSDALLAFYRPDILKFDEHHYGYDKNLEGTTYWEEPPSYLIGYLEAFALELQKDPGAVAYLVGYRGSERSGPRDVQRILRIERAFLIKEFKIRPARIRTIYGGYREWRTMELWIGRGGARPVITSYRYAKR